MANWFFFCEHMLVVDRKFQNRMRFLAVTIEQDAYSEVMGCLMGPQYVQQPHWDSETFVGSSLPTSAVLTELHHATWTIPDSSLASTTTKNFFRFQSLWCSVGGPHILSLRYYDAFAYNSEAGAITGSSCRMILEPRTYSSVWCSDSPVICLVVCIATDWNITAMNRNYEMLFCCRE
jgi:hypothetical protein